MQLRNVMIVWAVGAAIAVPWSAGADVSVSVNIQTERTIAEEEVIVETGEEDGVEALTTQHIVHESFVPTRTTVVRETEIVYVTEPPPPVMQETIVIESRPSPKAVWVTGYWYRQQSAKRYIWVSGGWRYPPEGMAAWVTAEYVKTLRGYVYVSGYWRPTAVATVKTVYISTMPPEPIVDVVPVRPGPTHVWVRGSWEWQAKAGRYAWQQGRWTPRRSGYVYVTPTYRYTPRGYVHVAGYWDRPVAKRGVVYRPIVVDNPQTTRVITPRRTVRFKTTPRRTVVAPTRTIRRTGPGKARIVGGKTTIKRTEATPGQSATPKRKVVRKSTGGPTRKADTPKKKTTKKISKKDVTKSKEKKEE